ncbi:LON peptidase N-terminal domain and RING finger protein 3-like isoform X2 [Leucoraja erinacea]|uniref:LON peptidase N-terminal domain and RING finger protein 3-like isoform X2 n=1 Tax=Leucoraja erinaceus TaxID=7782 RepID=UPI0024549616|nr:LON peptidase N-terminal domain and RING finger protein 3-like isoform X2 [Leucoraja erinacea]
MGGNERTMGSEGGERQEMLQLASQAFETRNFQLAAEIYECQLEAIRGVQAEERESELRLNHAHCLALGGRLAEAVEQYKVLSQRGILGPQKLEVLVDCLAKGMRDSQGWTDGDHPTRGLVGCSKCTGTLYEPVTLRCGHTHCKNCLDRERDGGRASATLCKLCKEKLPVPSASRINVVLNSFLNKYFAAETRALTLRHEGNVLYKNKKPQAALEKYQEAIALAPRDHLLLSNRAQINASMKCFEDALHDGNAACILQPTWSKGHLRRAQALAGLQKLDQALKEYIICIALDSENKMAKSEAQKGIVNSLSPSNALDNLRKENLDTDDICVKKEWKAHSYGNLTKADQMMNDNKDPLKTSTAQPALTRPEERTTQKTKYDFVKDDKAEITEENSKCFKRARKQSPSREDDEQLNLVDPFDLECSLCMRLFYEPITTPCGHTFCLKCIERCMDHSPKCPLCKEILPEYQTLRKYSKTSVIEDLIAHYLPEVLAERKRVNDDEMAELSNLNKAVPIFICTMAYPNVPCPLHVFEPCYRLMIRRCMEFGNKQFGMCMSDPVKGFADFGCILEVRNAELFADGRSVVDTIGRRRFKVLSHNEKDGYSMANVEYLEDVKVAGEPYTELLSLHNLVYDQAFKWFSSLKQGLKSRILSHFGPIPRKDSDIQESPDGPGWCWWLLAVLPLENRAQLPFLAMTSLQDRLNGIRRVLLFMSRNCRR